VIGAGVKPEWLDAGPVEFGPTLTPHGPVSVRFARESGGVRARIDGSWRQGAPPRRELRVPGCEPLDLEAGDRRKEFLLPHRGAVR
jgi:hypothetical protein